MLSSLDPAFAGWNLHYTNHWHDHQPLYWPNKTRASTAERAETAAENINFGNSNPWAGFPVDNISSIFGLADRVAAYQYRCRDALSTITSYPEAGFTASYTGALGLNVNSLANAFMLGYSPGWNGAWQQGRSWMTAAGNGTSGGHTRMDILLTGFAHSTIFGLIPDRTLGQRLIEMYKAFYPELWGTSPPMSTGFWPLEIAFSERNIPMLVNEGATWTYFANSHLSRCMPNWPATAGNGMNTNYPNKADQYDPAGTTGWQAGSIDGRPTTNELREAYRPHMLQYIDPNTGNSSYIIGVPAGDYEGYLDGYSMFSMGVLSPVANAQDLTRPAMVPLAHDGDNAWGGGYDSYMTNTPSKASQAAGNGWFPSSIAQYLADHPVPATDIWHVEDGPWVNPDGDFGSPIFVKWNWPWETNPGTSAPFFDPTSWSGQSQFWAIMTALTNRLLTAESYAGTPNMTNVVHPDNGLATDLEKAWHYAITWMDSGHIYYGQASDFSYIPVINGNRSASFADNIIGTGVLPPSAKDTVPPTIWVPQRFPYNPGSTNYGMEYGWKSWVYSPECDIYTFAYDASGLASVTLFWRKATGTNQTPVKPDNFTYAGGAAVGPWNQVAMTTGTFTPRIYLNNTQQVPAPVLPTYVPTMCWTHLKPGASSLVDYYIQAVDSKGNVQKTDIFHCWFGNGSGATGGGGGGGGSLWSPQNPTADQKITIAISTLNVTGATAGYLHFGVNNGVAPTGWKLASSAYWPAGSVQCDAVSVDAPLTAVSQPSIGVTSYTVTLGPFLGGQSVSEADFVFHWGGTSCTGGTWNNNGGANWAIQVGAANNVQPSPPTRITPTTRNQQIDVSWNASTSPSINGYNIYQWNNGSSTYTKINTGGLITGTSYGVMIDTTTSASLVNGTNYTYVVTAVNSSLNPESPYSVSITTSPSLTDTSAPGVPTNPAATGGVAQVFLSWTKDIETDLKDYRVYLGNASGSYTSKVVTATVINPLTNVTVTGLTANVTYYFQVTARDMALNESAPSFEVSAMAQSIPPPAAPTGVNTTPGNMAVTLSWSANTESNLAGYNTYSSTVSGGPYTKVNSVLITTTTYTYSGLTNGTAYYFRVTAVNTSGGESAFSGQVTATPNTSISCVFQVDMRSVPSVTSVAIAQNTLAPVWSASGFPMTNQGGALNGVYKTTLTLNPNTAFQWKYVYNGATWESDFGTAPNNNRSVTIAPNNGNSMYNDNVWNVAGNVIPAVPTNLSATGNAAGALVSWSTVTAYDLQQYNLYQSTWQANPSYSFAVSATSTSFQFSGLTTGVTYYFKVEAQCLTGNKSGQSSSVSAIANQVIPPAIPQGVTASPNDRSIGLSWTANTEPNLAGYLVSYGTTSGGSYNNQAPLVSAPTTVYTLSGLTDGVTYFVVIQATNTAGVASGYSSQVSATPAVQIIFDEKVIDGQFLDWKPSNVRVVSHHDDEYMLNDGFDQSRDIIALYSAEGKNNYYFRVDFLDLLLGAEVPDMDVYMMLSWPGQSSGGQVWIPDNLNCQTDTPWKVGVAVYDTNNYKIYNSTWGTDTWAFAGAAFSSTYHSVEFAINKQVLKQYGWTTGTPLNMQCFTTKDATTLPSGPSVIDSAGLTIDRTGGFLRGSISTNQTYSGRAKYAFIYHGNQSINFSNDINNWIYSQMSNGTSLQPTGYQLGLDTIQKYGVKGNIHPSGSLLSALQWANPAFVTRISSMITAGQVGLVGGVMAEHMMPYFENNQSNGIYVNAESIREFRSLSNTLLNPPTQTRIFWTPERVIRGTTFGDILNYPDTGQSTGYTATILDDNYHMLDWFGMPLSQRYKLHKVNGVYVFLIDGINARNGLPAGGDTNPDGSKFWVVNGGALTNTRQTLVDLAMSSDQQQVVTVMDDWEAYAGRSFTSSLANNNAVQWDQTIGWIGEHQWIETVLLDDILNRGWTPIDHGNNTTLPVDNYDWLWHANQGSYDSWYYGSSAEQSFSNRVPMMIGTTPIASNKTYGQIGTAGTLMRDSWDAIRNAPANQLQTYAKMVYNTLTFETAWHDENDNNKYDPISNVFDNISGWATYLHGHVRDSAIIAHAAQWAQNVASGTQTSATTAESVDLDLDGQNEYILRNNKVYAVFKQYGGRLMMAFAYDPVAGGIEVMGDPAVNYEYEGEEIGTKHVHGFQDMNNGTYTNMLYNVQIWSSSITFKSTDNNIIKTISLPANSDTLTANYITSPSSTTYYVRFGLCPNGYDMYTNGKKNLVTISSGSTIGVSNTAGGQALLKLGTGVQVNTGFSDGTGDNTNSPHTKIYELMGSGNFTISLILNNGGAVDTVPPGNITDLIAVTGSTTGVISLTWSAPGDNGYTGNIVPPGQYLVNYATNPPSGNINGWLQTATLYSQNWPVGVQGYHESQSVSGLATGTLYFVAIRTQDESNNISGVQVVASTWTLPDTNQPSAVTSLTAQSGSINGSVLLQWIAPGMDGTTGTASVYDIRYTSTASLSPSLSTGNFYSDTAWPSPPLPLIYSSPQSLLVTGLTPAVTYYFGLLSKNLSQWSNLSNDATAMALNNTTPPSDITSLYSVIGNAPGQILLSWTAPGNTGTIGTAFNYFINVSTQGNITNNTDFGNTAPLTTLSSVTVTLPLPSAYGNNQSMTVTGLTNGATYWFAIRANNQTGYMNNWTSNLSVNATNYAQAGLQTVTGLAGSTVSVSSMLWTWVDIPGESGYQIVAATGGAMSSVLAAHATYYTETGLQPNQKSGRQVKAIFGSLSSLSASATLYTLANPPTGTSVSTVTFSTVTILWNTNSDSSGTVFELRRATYSNVDQTVPIFATFNSPTSSYSYSNYVVQGSTYYYNLRAINGNGIPTAFDVTVTTVIPRILPDPITNLSAVSGSVNGSVVLSWTAPGAAGGVIVNSYFITYATFAINDGNWNSAALAQGPPNPLPRGYLQTFTINNLSPGTVYFFAGKSSDSAGNLSLIDTTSPQASTAAANVALSTATLPNPPIYIAFLWHMHQPIYWPYESPVVTDQNGRFGYSVVGVVTSRFDDYTDWPYNAVSNGANAGLHHLGASVNVSGALAENIKDINAAGAGFGGDWAWSYRTAYNMLTQADNPPPPGAVSGGGGNHRMDIVEFGYHHPLNGLISYDDIKAQIEMHRIQMTNTYGTPSPPSRGIFPTENAFREEMIPALVDEGIQWAIVDNIHFDRAVKGYPWNSGGNLYEPNPGDQINNPAGITWLQLNNLWAPTKVSVPWGYKPHYVQYTDPSSGQVKKMIAVPGARYEGVEDARGGFGALVYDTVMSQYASFNTDARHPMLVVLVHDGDNYGGGTSGYYNANFSAFISWLLSNPSRFVCTTIQDYLDMFPPDPNDVIHVENGSWSGAQNGDPEFLEWNDSGFDRVSQAVIIAAKNRVDTAKAILPPISNTNIVNGTGNNTELALHWFYCGEASDYEYWDGVEPWDSDPTRATNQAVSYADQVINANPGVDKIGPSIYIPWRTPYNPGSTMWGVMQTSTFTVWSLIYDVSGVSSATVMYRVNQDGNRHYLFDGSWFSLPMTAQNIVSTNQLQPTYIAPYYSADVPSNNNVMIDYYVSATDKKGNVSNSPIEHVFVGTGSGGGGGGNTLWSPSNPGINDLITIKASQPNKPGKLHWGVNSWTAPNPLYYPANSTTTVYNTQSVETVLLSTVSGSYFAQIGPFNVSSLTVNTVNFVFHWNDNTWDNNSNQNWNININNTVNNSSPVVTVTYPNNFSSVAGSSVNVSANVTDPVGISSVSFYYRASTSTSLVFISSTIITPYTVNWNTTLIPDQTTYMLSAKAEDANGMIGTSPEVQVNVNNHNSPPTISLTSPVGGEQWTGKQNIYYVANDTDGDVVTITLQYAPPGSAFTNIGAGLQNLGVYTWDTTLLSNSTSYQVKVIATDPAGATALATSGLFTLRNYPSDVNDLNAQAAVGATQVTLTWTAPGANGTQGTALTYDIRYSTNLLTSPALNISSFNADSSVQIFVATPTPSPSGTSQSLALPGLLSQTSYYFALRASNGIPLWDNISNGATVFTAVDVTSPSAVTSLYAASLSGSQAKLNWISPGEDGTIGNLNSPSQFLIKYSTNSADLWNAANQITLSTNGVIPGTWRSSMVTGLSPGTSYYFWVRTQDSGGLIAPLSNTATSYTPSGRLTYHIIPMDGSMSGWDNNTELMNLSNGDSFYFTWSSTEIYIGYGGPDGDMGSANFMVFFDTQTSWEVNIGSGSSPAGPENNGVNAHSLPFWANYALVVEKPGGTNYSALQNWTGTSWNDPGTMGGLDQAYVGWSGNKNTEISIPFSSLNNPTRLRVMAFHSWQTQMNIYNSYPKENPAPNTQTKVNFNYFYDIPSLGSGVTPELLVHFSTSLFVDAPPSAITNLSALTASTKGLINLSWSAPGDDGTTGTLVNGTYRIDYSSNSSYTFSGPSTYKFQLTANNNPGDTVTSQANNLVAGATYYFRAWTQDPGLNWSPISNGATAWAWIDTVPPSQVNNLSAATGVNPGQIVLTWSAPGDDGTTGASASYTVMFGSVASNSPASSDSNFSSGQNLNGTSPVPAPAAYGTNQSIVVTGLTQGVTYYFALKAYDPGGANPSILSNGATAWAQVSVPVTDTLAPSAVTNLSAQSGTNTGDCVLTWTAPGDDGTTGNNLPGSYYQLKYATYSVSGGANSSTTTWWNNAQTYTQSWSVSAQGATENHTVTLSAATTYYFAIKTVDAAGLVSALDTRASSTTSSGSNIAYAKNGTLSGGASLVSGGVSGQVVQLSNSGDGVKVSIANAVTNQLVSAWASGNNGVNGSFQKNGSGFFNYSSWNASYATASTNNQNFSVNDTVGVSLTQTGTVDIDYFIVNGAFGGGTQSNQATCVSAAVNDTSAPSAITNLSGTQGSSAGQVVLTWSAPSDPDGAITNGQYRISYSTNPNNSWDVNTYQVQFTSSTSAGISQGYVVPGLSNGVTYYFIVWSADQKPNWSAISNAATAYATNGSGGGSANILIDGIKDTAWGNTPLATSAGFDLPDNRARDLYAADDGTYLYVGFQFNGDPWDDGLNSNWVVMINTGSTPGVAADPWVNTISVNWANKPNISIAGWINGPTVTNFGGMTLYRAIGGAWDGGNALISGAGSDFMANKNNDWAEFKVAMSSLGVVPGQKINMILLFQPANNKPGVSDSTPFDGSAGACNDYGNSGSNLSQYVTYTFSGGDQIPPAAVTGISATQGASGGQVNLTWTMPGDDGWSGSITNGQFRVAFSSNPNFNFQLSNYNVQQTTTSNPNTSNGYLVTGLSAGSTYYFRVWVADPVPLWSGISAGATAWATLYPPPAPVFTPVIDGVKDASWGSQPNVTSPGFDLPDNRARDIYVTNDANYLYVGFQFNGDPWPNDNLSAHYIFLFDTGTPAGTATDPWVNTTSVNWPNKPDVSVAGWVNNTANFGGMTRYKSNGTSWDGGTAMVSGTDFSANTANDWAEFRVPLSVLGATASANISQVNMVLLFRPDSTKPGVSDTTPFDPNGASNYGNGSPAVVSQSFTYWIRPTADVTTPAALTNLSAYTGVMDGSISLTWSAPGHNGNSGQLLPGSNFAIQYSASPSVVWSTANAQIVISTAYVNPGTTESYFLSGLANGSTYYFRGWTENDSNNWSPISNGTTVWAQVDVTSPAAITNLSAALGSSVGQVLLTWMAPADTGTEIAGIYDIRMATSPDLSPALSNASFNSAGSVSSYSPIPAPLSPGSTQSLTVTGLTIGQAYYFAMRAKDQSGNISPVSNGATSYAQLDLVPPAQVTSLTSLPGGNHGEVSLTWTNPGNDGLTGNLTGYYQIAVSTNPANIWGQTSYQLQIATYNAPPYSQQSITITALNVHIPYYFAIRTGEPISYFQSPVWAPLSNGSTVQTAAYATILSSTTRTPEHPRPGDSITYTLTFGNTGIGAAPNFTISNKIPNYTSYSTGTIQLNGVSQSDSSSYQNGIINVNYGTLGVGVTNQTVTYQVTPQ